MDPSFFVRGLVIGFSIAAPVGPIGVLCIRRTLAEGRATGFVSGLGAASADAVYGSIAAFGLTFISSALIDQRLALHVIGGAFLCYLGLRTLLARPADQAAVKTEQAKSLVGAFASIFLLTLTNPLTIFSFAAIFAGLGVASATGSYATAAILVLGVFSGSALWWLLLSGGVSLLRTRIGPSTLQWVNWFSGAIITAFGVLALVTAAP
jgi:threonine/homoserine/homoserine lactone efflux protein